MKKIALAAATLLALSGAALAENPNVGGTDINTVAQEQQVDSTRTSSIGQDSAAYKLLNSGNAVSSDQSSAEHIRVRDFGSR
jgi:hypothetical protein